MTKHIGDLDNTSLDPACAGQRYWYVFLMSSLVTFFGGLFVIAFWRLLIFFNLTLKLKEKVNRMNKSTLIFFLY